VLTGRNLADTHNRGALDIGEFTIAMHLIQSFMSGALTSVPTSLPLELYASANVSSPEVAPAIAGFGSLGRTDSVSSAGSGRMAPIVPPKIQQSPIREDFTGGSQMEGWDVTPQDKAAFDTLFKGIGTGNKGFIEGTTLYWIVFNGIRQRGGCILLDVQIAR
jgi:epidermal growth factor receptor substrate 15